MLEFTGHIILALLIGLLIAPDLSEVIARLILWSQRKFGFPRNVKTGPEGMIGKPCVVVRDFDGSPPSGRVYVNGERWRAVLITSFEGDPPFTGTHLKVIEINGLTLTVGPLDSS